MTIRAVPTTTRLKWNGDDNHVTGEPSDGDWQLQVSVLAGFEHGEKESWNCNITSLVMQETT